MIDGRYVYASGTQAWYVVGQLHRLDGPAVIWRDGTQVWYVDDQLHRTDGPAVINADGTEEWYVNDQLHRTDGPAVIWADGTQTWWVNSKDITQEVAAWISIHNVTWPFDDNTRIQFILTFGGR